jgi:hypothetical protein
MPQPNRSTQPSAFYVASFPFRSIHWAVAHPAAAPVPPELISLSILGQFQRPPSPALSLAATANVSGTTSSHSTHHISPIGASASAKPSGLMSALSRAAHSTAANYGGASLKHNAATGVSMRALYEQDGSTVGW